MSQVARILIVLLVLCALFGGWGWHMGWHPAAYGGPTGLIVVLLVLALLGVI